MTTSLTPLRVGLIGANPERGWGLSAHIPALLALPQFEIAAIATTRAETAEMTAKTFDVPLAFSDAMALIEHADVDVVSVAVKVPEHDRLVLAAIAAGKHVFCEWPLSVDSWRARELGARADQAGVRHIVGLQGLHSPSARFVRELIESGAIGDVFAVSVVGSGGPAGRRIAEGNVYAVDPAAGATVLSISTGHTLATLSTAVGSVRDLVGLVATVNTLSIVNETGESIVAQAPDHVAMSGTLDNGAVVSIAIQGDTAPGASGFDLRIIGADGTLVAHAAGGIHIADWSISLADADGSFEELSVPQGFASLSDAIAPGPPKNVALLYQELASAIAEHRPATPNFAVAVRYHELLEALQRASDTGTRQRIA